MSKPLLIRLASALIGGPAVLFIIFFGDVTFFLLLMVVACLALYEYINMMAKKGIRSPLLYSLYPVTAVIIYSAFYPGTSYLWTNVWVAIAAVVAIAFFIFEVIRAKMFLIENEPALWLRAIFYIALPIACIILLRKISPYGGLILTVYLFLCVWLNDVYAYLIGKNWGKHKLYEVISPKKTVEGFWGGLIAVFIFNLIIGKPYGFVWWQILFFSVFIPVLATLGDLSESLLKRTVHTKDSGEFMPGHGGLLDRIDSFLLVVPVYFYIVLYSIHP
jgi:phosphatidate cytidylyltransferase